jgi:prepilin-type processing-associated H-X9-DG protein
VCNNSGNTIGIGEKMTRPDSNLADSTDDSWNAASVYSINDNDENQNFYGTCAVTATGGYPLNTHHCGFASAHEGGAHFLLLDGSVRFISENIDHKANNGVNGFGNVDSTFDRLIAREDGQVTGDFY